MNIFRLIENKFVPYGRAYRIDDHTLLVSDIHDTSIGMYEVIDIRTVRPDVCREALELSKADGWPESKYPPVSGGK